MPSTREWWAVAKVPVMIIVITTGVLWSETRGASWASTVTLAARI